MRTRVALLSTAVLVGMVQVPSSRAALDPCAAFDVSRRVADPVLGFGLTLGTGVEGNLFAAGKTPTVSLTVPAPVPGDYQLSYTVRDRTRTLAATTVALPQATTALPLPATGPGFYRVSAVLRSGGVELSGTCLQYGVAMPGSTLDLSNLPAGKDWGGGSAARDVAVHGMIGAPVVRRQVDVGRFIATPASYDNEFTEAAALSAANGTLLDVQVGQGGAAEKAAVANGTWEGIVRDLVTRQAGKVRYWEAWNEPSWKYPGTGADYVRNVLVPFARAVHAADPTAKVIGGSSFTWDKGWWNSFASAGGFAALDIVGVHPYGNPAGFDMSATPADLQWVAKLRNDKGAKGKPIWDTESAWQSTGYGSLWSQADNVARKLTWERILGIPSSAFLAEGGWEDWSMIDYFRGVKPAAIASSVNATVLQGRVFWKWLPTKDAKVHAALFRPDASGVSVTALWTDRDPATVKLKDTHVAYSETGARSVVRTSITASSQVVYLVNARGHFQL